MQCVLLLSLPHPPRMHCEFLIPLHPPSYALCAPQPFLPPLYALCAPQPPPPSCMRYVLLTVLSPPILVCMVCSSPLSLSGHALWRCSSLSSARPPLDMHCELLSPSPSVHALFQIALNLTQRCPGQSLARLGAVPCSITYFKRLAR